MKLTTLKTVAAGALLATGLCATGAFAEAIYQPSVEIVSVEPVENPFGSFKVTYRLSKLNPNEFYRLDLEYAAKGRTAQESVELGSVSDGDYTITRSSKALFGGLVVTPEAHVKLSLYGRSAAE